MAILLVIYPQNKGGIYIYLHVVQYDVESYANKASPLKCKIGQNTPLHPEVVEGLLYAVFEVVVALCAISCQ
jgi:hypothetical protein